MTSGMKKSRSRAIASGEMPVNANLEQRDPDCDLNLIVGEARKRPIRAALSNSFGFGGSNSCVVLRHPEYPRHRGGNA